MLILYVNGVAALKLGGTSEIPKHHGNESWKVIDEYGRTIDSYQPNQAIRHSHLHKNAHNNQMGMHA